MGVFKRGNVYWYRFMYGDKLIQESTHQHNNKVAQTQETAHRTRLSNDELFIREKKTALTLAAFCRDRFAPWAESSCSLKTWRDFYRVGLLAIEAYTPLANLALDAITSEQIAAFASHRQAEGMKPTTVNASLRILRRILRIAVEWGELAKVPKVKMLSGEAHRERVITPEEEAAYLLSASAMLAEVATVLVDSGLRPEECNRLGWDCITWTAGRHGTLRVNFGKTKAARRVLPMTPRVRQILEMRWNKNGRPLEGYVWAAPTKSGHIEPSTIKKQHSKALKLSKVRPFVLYSLRHTFLTRLGESGCDVWTLARVAGHSKIEMSLRYVHPSENAVLTAMERLDAQTVYNFEYSEKLPATGKCSDPLLTA